MDSAVTRRWEWAMLLVVLLAAAFLRLYRLDGAPPGWRDDELINSLVISQHVLDGEWALFYPDASGHEALYHILNAGFLALFGPGVPGIRWLSVILGLLSVWLVYLLGRQLFGRPVGLMAAIVLSFSFWSLMYSRVGLRHVSLLPFMLGGWGAWWYGLRENNGLASSYPYLCLSGVLLGLGFYTYFAARGLPLIVLALAGYWFLFDRPRFALHWRGVALVLLVTAVIAAPLFVALARLPEMTGRVEELAVPVVEARADNWEPLLRHARITLSMFHADGDDEWLYNIPHRPVFNSLGALLLLAGLLLSLYRALPFTKTELKSESVFLLLWLAAGLTPGIISVPPASLGHTIVAQPAVFILPAVAVDGLFRWGLPRWRWLAWGAAGALALLFLVGNAARDLKDYFTVWPERGMVRFLYRADIHDAAGYLNQHPEIQDLAFAAFVADPWDRRAMLADLERPVADRWFDPRRALVHPAGGGYLILTTFPELAQELMPVLEGTAELVADLDTFAVYAIRRPLLSRNVLPAGTPAPFVNGLALTWVKVLPAGLLTEWRADSPPFGLPPFKLVSNPPPPGVDTRPRLAVFVHWLDSAGAVVASDDGLWVDPYTLRPGDTFWQLHRSEFAGSYGWEIGLYDPVTGERVLLTSGDDRLVFGRE